MESKIDEVALAAQQALPLLEQGWTQRQFKTLYPDGDGRRSYCILGAIYETEAWCQAHQPSYHPGFMGTMTFRFRAITGWPGAMVSWNDHPSRTKEEVLDVMRRLAAGEGAVAE